MPVVRVASSLSTKELKPVGALAVGVRTWFSLKKPGATPPTLLTPNITSSSSSSRSAPLACPGVCTRRMPPGVPGPWRANPDGVRGGGPASAAEGRPPLWLNCWLVGGRKLSLLALAAPIPPIPPLHETKRGGCG
jgi:hypothetical protein